MFVDKCFAIMDADQSGEINFIEFVGTTTHQNHSPMHEDNKNIESACELYDDWSE